MEYGQQGNEWRQWGKVQVRGALEASFPGVPCYLEACFLLRCPHAPWFHHTPQTPGPGAQAGEGMDICKEESSCSFLTPPASRGQGCWFLQGTPTR